MTDRPIQWRVQDGSIIIGNNGLGTTVCYSASLHEVYRSLFIEVIAPLQPCSHYCLCILMLDIQLCFIKSLHLLSVKRHFYHPILKIYPSTILYREFFSTLTKKKLFLHLMVFFRSFLPPFKKVFKIIPLPLYKEDFFWFWAKYFLNSPSPLYKAEFFKFWEP